MTLNITADYQGGNIIFEKQVGNKVYLQQDLRTTKINWFYFNFCVKDAPEATIDFVFTNGKVIGPCGPAVSQDNMHWHFLNSRIDDYGFSYTFKENETLYFAFCPYFGFNLMQEFIDNNIHYKIDELCKSNKGRLVPAFYFGDHNKPVMIFTSRHHSCESPGTYALFGTMDVLSKNSKLLQNYSLAFFPFMDTDGVIDGDQGKERSPHDHNRDYKEELYNETTALKNFAKAKNVAAFIDYHAPYYYGEDNDYSFIVYSKGDNTVVSNYAKLLEKTHNSKNPLLKYNTNKNLKFGLRWNTDKNEKENEMSSTGWFREIHKTAFSFVMENSYTGFPYGTATPESLFEFGQSMGETIIEYFDNE